MLNVNFTKKNTKTEKQKANKYHKFQNYLDA